MHGVVTDASGPRSRPRKLKRRRRRPARSELLRSGADGSYVMLNSPSDPISSKSPVPRSVNYVIGHHPASGRNVQINVALQVGP